MLVEATLLLVLAGERIDLGTLLTEMADRSTLARWPEPTYTSAQSSSRDPAPAAAGKDGFSNADAGHFVRIEERADENGGRREGVLLDVDGPGAIVRIWSSTPAGRLRVYLDGADQPALDEDMQVLLSGRGFVAAPLAAEHSRGFELRLPIPYAVHCKVTCDEPRNLLYHVGFRTYARGTAVKSFARADFDACAQERQDLHVAWQEGGGSVPFDATTFTYSLSSSNPDGVLLCAIPEACGGPRAITAIELSLEAPDVAAALRSLLLRLRFDGEETVTCPMGDFFASAPGVNAFESAFASVRPPGTFLARWVMPYRERFDLVVENANLERDVHVSGAVHTRPFEFDERTLLFHARWRPSGPLSTRERSDWRHIAIEGRGLLAGDALCVANPTRAWWGEGDEKIYVDGEASPSTSGTGTADYYGFGWCDPSPFAAALCGQTRCDGPGSFGFTSLYRFRALDAIPFTERLSFEMENWHEAEVTVERAATVFYYARPGAKDDAPAVTARAIAERAPKLHVFRVEGALEAERLGLRAATPALEHEIELLAPSTSGAWSDGAQLWVKARQAGDFVELWVPVKEAGSHEILVHATQGPDYGRIAFAIDGHPCGVEFDGFGPELAPPKRVPLGVHAVGAGFALRIEARGPDARAKPPGLSFGIDCVVVR